MLRICYPALLFSIWLIIGLSCQNTPDNTSNKADNPVAQTVVAVYHGNLPTPEYDSLVNHLTMYTNETFDLHQVYRIAEHHLNEKNHNGIYAYLADSSRLGLYSEDGYLMLQFQLADSGLVPMIVNTDQVIDDNIVWKKQ